MEELGFPPRQCGSKWQSEKVRNELWELATTEKEELEKETDKKVSEHQRSSGECDMETRKLQRRNPSAVSDTAKVKWGLKCVLWILPQGGHWWLRPGLFLWSDSDGSQIGWFGWKSDSEESQIAVNRVVNRKWENTVSRFGYISRKQMTGTRKVDSRWRGGRQKIF